MVLANIDLVYIDSVYTNFFKSKVVVSLFPCTKDWLFHFFALSLLELVVMRVFLLYSASCLVELDSPVTVSLSSFGLVWGSCHCGRVTAFRLTPHA